jgi:xanthine dehydrogenase accessory factor
VRIHHWKETSSVVARLAELTAEHRRAALATVVRVEGSAYRRPGAKLLVVETGETLGSVSAGCLEADVREVAQRVIESGAPVLRHYDNANDDGVGALGLGCNGSVDIFVQLATDWPLASLKALLAGDSPVMLTTDLATGATTLGGGGDRAGTFVDILWPPPHVLVCGAGPDAIPLVAYASEAGFRVTVVDHREALLGPAAFPQAMRLAAACPRDPDIVLPPPSRTLAVIKTHSFDRDGDWLRLLLGLGVPYLGVLGPRARTQRILDEVCDDADVQGRVFAPIGLDLGAEGPQQIAISIVAELLAFIARREPRHLWQRSAPIHAD